MQCRRCLVRVFPGLILVMAVFLPAGCGVLNPALTGTVLPNSVSTLEAPQGSILIAVFNQTTSIAAVRFEITKKNGGTVDLVIPVQPADGNAANEADRGLAIQDCDVQSIRLVEVLASVPGGVQQFGTGLAPLEDGLRLSCGKVVAVFIAGTAPNLLASLDVF